MQKTKREGTPGFRLRCAFSLGLLRNKTGRLWWRPLPLRWCHYIPQNLFVKGGDDVLSKRCRNEEGGIFPRSSARDPFPIIAQLCYLVAHPVGAVMHFLLFSPVLLVATLRFMT